MATDFTSMIFIDVKGIRAKLRMSFDEDHSSDRVLAFSGICRIFLCRSSVVQRN